MIRITYLLHELLLYYCTKFHFRYMFVAFRQQLLLPWEVSQRAGKLSLCAGVWINQLSDK